MCPPSCANGVRFQPGLLPPAATAVEPHPFDYLWIAANELPLHEALIPFLVARSGKALEAFVLWVADCRPLDWVLDVGTVHRHARPQYAEPAARKIQGEATIPRCRVRQREIADKMLERTPHLSQKTEQKGRLIEARSMLRRVLSRRKLELSVEEQARIDACADSPRSSAGTDEAVTAASTAEALR